MDEKDCFGNIALKFKIDNTIWMAISEKKKENRFRPFKSKKKSFSCQYSGFIQTNPLLDKQFYFFQQNCNQVALLKTIDSSVIEGFWQK